MDAQSQASQLSERLVAEAEQQAQGHVAVALEAQAHVNLAEATVTQVTQHAESMAAASQRWCAEQITAAQNSARHELEQSTSATSAAHAAQMAAMQEQLQQLQSRLLEGEASKTRELREAHEARQREVSAVTAAARAAIEQMQTAAQPTAQVPPLDIQSMQKAMPEATPGTRYC